MTTSKGEVRVPITGVGVNAQGVFIGMTQVEFDAAWHQWPPMQRWRILTVGRLGCVHLFRVNYGSDAEDMRIENVSGFLSERQPFCPRA